MPINVEAVGQYLHNWVFVVRHAEGAIAQPGDAVLRPDRVSCARHARSGSRRSPKIRLQKNCDSRAQRVRRYPRGFGVGAVDVAGFSSNNTWCLLRTSSPPERSPKSKPTTMLGIMGQAAVRRRTIPEARRAEKAFGPRKRTTPQGREGG